MMISLWRNLVGFAKKSRSFWYDNPVTSSELCREHKKTALKKGRNYFLFAVFNDRNLTQFHDRDCHRFLSRRYSKNVDP